MTEELDQYRIDVLPVKINLPIVCEDEKYMPSYANPTDACMDLKIKIKENWSYYSPETHERFVILGPKESVVLPTGIKMKIPKNYFVQIFPRSSTGFKLNCMLANTVGIIDTGFRDEIKIKLYNFGDEIIHLKDGQRIAQFVLLPRPLVNIIQVEENEEFLTGDRGGGFGSTGS